MSGSSLRPVFHFATLHENNASPSARVRSLRVVGSSNLPRDGQAGLPAISIDFVGKKTVKQRVRILSGTGLILAQFEASATSRSYNSCNSSRLAPAMVKALQAAAKHAYCGHFNCLFSAHKRHRFSPRLTLLRHFFGTVVPPLSPIPVKLRNWILHPFAGMEK